MPFSSTGRGRVQTRRLLAAAPMLAVLAACAPAAASAPAPAAVQTAAPVRWGSAVLRQDAAWYASAEARRLADTVLLYQFANGSWPKNTDMSAPPATPVDPELGDTIDNQATTLEMEFLARVIQAGAPNSAAYVAAFDKGFDWVLAAQYPNGGWPQFFPLRTGYYTHITYNDDAMVRVLNVLRDVSNGAGPYGFVDAGRKAKAAEAVARGIDIILKTQIRQDGKLTVWCAQHDEVTLAPAWARKFEPPSLSGYESVGITRFLMGVPNPSPEIIAAVEGSVAWFRSTVIPDIAVERFTNAEGQNDRRVIPAPGARLWARFYELGTNRPIFLGRDSVVHPALADIERERRAGYNYFDGAAAGLIDRDYPAWRRRVGLPAT
ncbi:pectate lyase [Brevundimonas goettingensis]|uniref:Pectate lyase n=1 Tax=Brevundimonas goettingensis TaxID=2774190 RepID=A0A975BZS4_9CAUL|nr:pectate lyase [Brevundimonas goettingensis]QTC90973.1 pectate lyase [Brevundimonas goettingensis]